MPTNTCLCTFEHLDTVTLGCGGNRTPIQVKHVLVALGGRCLCEVRVFVSVCVFVYIDGSGMDVRN